MHAAIVQDAKNRLARDVYKDDAKKVREIIVEWFSERRLSQLLQKEEKRKASLGAAKSGAVTVEATVVRIVDACAGKDVACTICKGTSERSRRVAARTTWCAVSPCDMGGYIIAS